jgi:hypothetical protein
MNILFSPSTKRVIWYDGNQSITAQLTDDYEWGKAIHFAPIGVDDMSELFTNEGINDWEKRSIELWKELEVSNG